MEPRTELHITEDWTLTPGQRIAFEWLIITNGAIVRMPAWSVIDGCTIEMHGPTPMRWPFDNIDSIPLDDLSCPAIINCHIIKVDEPSPPKTLFFKANYTYEPLP